MEETLTWFIEYPHGPLVRRIPVGEGPTENDWRAAIKARLVSLEYEITVLKARQMP